MRSPGIAPTHARSPGTTVSSTRFEVVLGWGAPTGACLFGPGGAQWDQRRRRRLGRGGHFLDYSCIGSGEPSTAEDRQDDDRKDILHHCCCRGDGDSVLKLGGNNCASLEIVQYEQNR